MSENEFEYDGVVYEAIQVESDNGCCGCALDNDDICILSDRPRCIGVFRSDAMNVIFTEKQQ